MNRRDFLKLSSVSATVLAVDLALPEHAFAKDTYDVQKNGFSILQGLTTQTTTQLTVDVPKQMNVHYELIHTSTGKSYSPHYLKQATRDSSDWRVDKLAYINLPYLGEFIFRVLDDKKKILDERNLGLLDIEKRDARFAMMSCMMDSNKNKDVIWPRVEQADCDLLFFIGDHVYGDILATFNGPELLWRRYIETRQKLPYYHWKNLKPALVTWDDHDYGANNTNGNYKHKNDSLDTFRAFTAQDDIVSSFENGPGVSSFFRAFGQKFLLLDNRYFKGLMHNGMKGFLGQDQMDWAFSRLVTGTEPNWIMEGSQFFQGQRKGNECYILDAPQECELFRKKISQLNSPSVFAAGDVHFTEVNKLPKDYFGYNTVEITSSSLHSMAKSSLPKNPTRLYGEGAENFVVIDLVPTQYELSFAYQDVTAKKVSFKGSFGI
ncbi:MAG: hypothetical protein V4596_07020 [Bdellovibrionota bacterium]